MPGLPSALFVLVIVEIRSHFFAQASLNHDIPILWLPQKPE
jgi:hypothetical protein